MLKNKLVTIKIYGIWNEIPVTSGCSCGGGCAPATKTMGEMFEASKKFLEKSDLKEKISLNFIDIIKDMDPALEQVRQLFKAGYSLPLAAINDEWAFSGDVPNELFYAKIEKFLLDI